jgi:Mn2+/Fe2+ NRAMP family transporter
MIVITFSRAVVQEMCGRLGAATGRGLLDLIRERFGFGWAMYAVAVILIANGSLVMTEFVGIGAAAELFGVSKFVAAPAAAALIWYLVIFGNCVRVEKIFLLMTLVFFAYPAAAVLGRPDWGGGRAWGLRPHALTRPGLLSATENVEKSGSNPQTPSRAFRDDRSRLTPRRFTSLLLRRPQLGLKSPPI